MYDIIIAGAGCAGLTAAIYAARAGKKVLVLEAAVIGGQIAFSPKVENYPGFKMVSGYEFSDNLYEQALALDVGIELERVERVELDGDDKKVITDGGEYRCRALIIAAGAEHRKLGLPEEDDYLGQGVSYCVTCDGAFFKGKETAVVGGGSTALLGAETLSQICSKVYLIHRRDTFRGETHLVERLKKKKNVEIITDTVVEKLSGDQALECVYLKNTKTQKSSVLTLSGLFVCIGQQPDNGVFSPFVQLDEAGYIVSDETCLTGTPGVYAAGDCRTKAVRQLTTAAADGTVAALTAAKWIDDSI